MLFLRRRDVAGKKTVAEKAIQRHINESQLDYLTYCAMRRNSAILNMKAMGVGSNDFSRLLFAKHD